MGGDHDHHHGVGIKVPDYKIYKVDDVPQLAKVRDALAKRGLKDPWLRNYVWMFNPELSGGKTQGQRARLMVFRGFKVGFGLCVVSVVVETLMKFSGGTNGGHKHHEEHHAPPPPPPPAKKAPPPPPPAATPEAKKCPDKLEKKSVVLTPSDITKPFSIVGQEIHDGVAKDAAGSTTQTLTELVSESESLFSFTESTEVFTDKTEPTSPPATSTPNLNEIFVETSPKVDSDESDSEVKSLPATEEREISPPLPTDEEPTIDERPKQHPEYYNPEYYNERVSPDIPETEEEWARRD